MDKYEELINSCVEFLTIMYTSQKQALEVIDFSRLNKVLKQKDLNEMLLDAELTMRVSIIEGYVRDCLQTYINKHGEIPDSDLEGVDHLISLNVGEKIGIYDELDLEFERL